MITPESYEELLSWGVKQLWTCFKQLMEDETEDGQKISVLYQDELYKVKFGVKLKFPVWYMTNEWFEAYPTSKKVRIMGYGKIAITDFMEEKDSREAVMRKVIAELMDQGGITKPRTPEEDNEWQ